MTPPPETPRYGDWITWSIVLLGTMIALAATLELWAWHPWR